MSEQDNKMNINNSGGKLNAGAAAFVPGNYESKPATTKSGMNNGNGGPKSGGPHRSGYHRNNNRNYNNMMQGGYYSQNSYGMTPDELYLYQMQQYCAAQNCLYDPSSNMMYNPTTNMMYLIAPEYLLDPSQYNADYNMNEITGDVTEATGVVTETTGDVTETTDVVTKTTDVVTETTGDVTEKADVMTETTGAATEKAEVKTETESTAAPVVKKYVPPTRSTTDIPTTTTSTVGAVENINNKLSGLTIEDNINENIEPVDIETISTEEVRRYTKNMIVELYNSDNTIIPVELESYYKPSDYIQGSVNGKPYSRKPLDSILTLAEAGVAFGGMQNNRTKSSSSNMRHHGSNNNLERVNSNNNFSRRNRNEKDREAGEIMEGEEGYIPYDPNHDDNLPKERIFKQKKSTTYKSKFVLDASDPLAIVRKANGILNKLSITNFDKLSNEFLNMMMQDIVNLDLLNRSVEALVTKAQMEENFCFIYADLCRKIIDQWEDLEPDTGAFMNTTATADATTSAATADATTTSAGAADATTTSAGAATTGATTTGATTTADATTADATTTAPTTAPTTTSDENKQPLRPMGRVFKDALLSRCQTEFEYDHISVLQEIRDNMEYTSDEKTEKEILLKKRITGHMRFIGELYMKDLITANIMKNNCLEILLKSTIEEELVCLCKLFQTVGAKLEKYHYDKSRQKKYKDSNMQQVVPEYFHTISIISKTHPSSRVRFMMKDLIEMRENQWTARREEEKMINLDKKNISTEFTSVSGDARSLNTTTTADEWLTVPSTGRMKKTNSGMSSGAPSPIPTGGGGSLSRSGSNASFSRSANASANNLTGLDRRGARGTSNTNNGIAGQKKDKSSTSRGDSRGDSKGSMKENNSRQARGSSRGASASPVPNKDGDNVPSTTTTSTTTTKVLSYNTDLADIQKHVRSAMKEYYTNSLIEEPKLTFQELRPSPTLMSDIVKDMISQAVESSSEKSCGLLCDLLHALRSLSLPGLPSTTTVLTTEDVKEAVFKFLNSFDDVLIDAPKAGTLGAVIVAHLCLQDALSLELFGALPEDNEFIFSTKFAEFVVQVLAALSALAGPEKAAELYKQSQFDLLKVINAPPKETPEDTLRALAKKHNVTFLA